MQATIQYIEKELGGLYPKSEIQGFVRILLEAVLGWNYTQQVLKKGEEISQIHAEKIIAIIARLKTMEPIQYILGETEFYGLKLNVNPAVLIPRPETEELVEWIIKRNFLSTAKILDIGTGSGCIALSLKCRLINSKVFGVDISEKALEVARGNAIRNNLDVDFFQCDILNWEKYNWRNYDVVVSNPPYVRMCEKAEMKDNVLKYEPESALFVSDQDPLVFYRSIAAFAKKYLNKNGLLFFEINEYLGEEINKLLLGFGFWNIEIKADMNGKKRMACGVK